MAKIQNLIRFYQERVGEFYVDGKIDRQAREAVVEAVGGPNLTSRLIRPYNEIALLCTNLRI